MDEQSDTGRQRHILTVVLEDYCHVGTVSRVVPPGYWHRFESRVQRNTTLALDLLDEVGAKATFFALGWIADNQPEVIAEVVRRGHEIASKGYFHRSIQDMSKEEFREDALRSREALERAAGAPVRGYRIARNYFSSRDLWALDVLSEEGFDYDSSIRPLGLGFRDQPHRRFLHRHQWHDRVLWEVPLSSWKLGPFCIPISGGNYVRQLPDAFVRRAVAQWDRSVDAPFVFYFHIWELDPDQPRITAVSPLQSIRQYRNLDTMAGKVRYYLDHYRFTSVAEHLALPPSELAIPRAKPDTFSPARIDADAERTPDVRRPITVVVPCYNEEATLGYLANTLECFADHVAGSYDVSYIFIDDGSRDATWERLNELFGRRADCELVRHPRNRGIAAATLTGFAHAKTEIICAIDADGTYDPKQLKEMIAMLASDVDLVTASPYHEFGEVMNVPVWRLTLSKGASFLYRLVLRNKLATYTSCFRVYRRTAVKDIVLKNQGFVGIVEILSKLDMKGGRVVECPAVIEIRLLGHSKVKVLGTIAGHLKLLTQLTVERWLTGLYPKHSGRRGGIL
jgi:polysaccharide deacetylase family protein (PEP-CTERM system associated)